MVGSLGLRCGGSVAHLPTAPARPEPGGEVRGAGDPAAPRHAPYRTGHREGGVHLCKKKKIQGRGLVQ